MAKRIFQLKRDGAEELARIISELTPSRVGSLEDYLFLAELLENINTTFPTEKVGLYR